MGLFHVLGSVRESWETYPIRDAILFSSVAMRTKFSPEFLVTNGSRLRNSYRGLSPKRTEIINESKEWKDGVFNDILKILRNFLPMSRFVDLVLS